jgi:chemotaxis protein methyltransferase CheR
VLPPSWRVEVHGTDIDRAALARAERGEYGHRALRNLPPAIRRGNLEERDGTCRVRDRVRAAVRFHHLNLAAPEADTWANRHGPFHAVFCRNVLIYFSLAEVERAVNRFEKALLPGGGLFLGASETLHRARTGMDVVRGSGSFFFHKVAPARARGPERLAPHVPPPDPDGEQAQELYDLGLSRLDAEDFPGAGDAFRELLGLCPEDARGHTGMALLLANQGRDKEAGKHLDQVSRCSPDLAEAHYLRGLVAERTGQDREALVHYAATLAREPGFFMAHINRAWILERLENREQCRAEMRAALLILQKRPSVAPWVTGGLGCEALQDLVRGALDERGDGQ